VKNTLPAIWSKKVGSEGPRAEFFSRNPPEFRERMNAGAAEPGEETRSREREEIQKIPFSGFVSNRPEIRSPSVERYGRAREGSEGHSLPQHSEIKAPLAISVIE
jgi:hypothetical protein